MNFETMYGQLIVNALPGVSFPAGYDFIAEHENDIKRVRDQAEVDATLERDALKVQLEAIDRKAQLRAKAKAGSLTDDELDELENTR